MYQRSECTKDQNVIITETLTPKYTKWTPSSANMVTEHWKKNDL